MKVGIELVLPNGKLAKMICFTRKELSDYLSIIKIHYPSHSYKLLKFYDYDEVESWLTKD